MARFISPITDMKPNGSLNFFDANTNLPKLTFKDELETIVNLADVPVNANGNIENVFFSGSATVKYLDEFDVQYASRTPVGEEVGIGNFTMWSSNIIYSNPDITIGSNDKFYISITAGNQGNDPTTDEVNWEEIRFIGLWNTNITYEIGVVVQTTDGTLWRSLTATAGNDPETDDGTNWASQGLSSIATPTNTTPVDSAINISVTPTLVGSAFSGGTDIHTQSNWQVTLATDTAFTSPVINIINSDLEAYTADTTDKLDTETAYIWRVRYIGVNGFSDFSTPTSFTTALAISSLFASTKGTGNASTQQYISGLDYVARNGVVWGKSITNATSHRIFSTLRGVGEYLESDNAIGEQTGATTLTAFNNDGFTLGADAAVNGTGDFIFWQWLVDPGFFDVVGYGGDGIAGNTVTINLADGVAAFGMALVRNLDQPDNWFVQHRSLGGTKNLVLNDTPAAATSILGWNDVSATATTLTLGTSPSVNASGENYEVMAFAHNTLREISCDEYNGTGAIGNKVVTGFAVKFLMVFNATSGGGQWYMFDIARSPSNPADNPLSANENLAEAAFGVVPISFDTDGFTINSTVAGINESGSQIIFMALGG